jgi:hypothetical protein
MSELQEQYFNEHGYFDERDESFKEGLILSHAQQYAWGLMQEFKNQPAYKFHEQAFNYINLRLSNFQEDLEKKMSKSNNEQNNLKAEVNGLESIEKSLDSIEGLGSIKDVLFGLVNALKLVQAELNRVSRNEVSTSSAVLELAQAMTVMETLMDQEIGKLKGKNEG